MAKKTLILSQKQLDEIVGGGMYLDDSDENFVEDGANMVYTGDKMGDHDAKPKTTDDFAKTTRKELGMLSMGRHGYTRPIPSTLSYCEESTKKDWAKKNIVTEENQNLVNNLYGEKGDKVTNNNASTIKTRIEKAQANANSGDPIKKAKGQETLRRMQQNHNTDLIMGQYNNAMAVDNSSKQYKSKVLGQNNVFQKPKNGIITYEN